jgi:uncharacterized protein (DUF302 family)
MADRRKTHRTLAMLAAGVALCLSLPAPSWTQQLDLKVYSKKGSYEDVKFELQNAIVSRGLVVDFNGNVGGMLERTGADVGSTTPIYKQAEYFTFCSAKLSRATMEADAANIGYCPYVIFVYETAAAPGTVHVGYRPPEPHGSDASRAALAEVKHLLDGITQQAVK